MAQDLGQLTDEWMVNPWMFDPTQKSNQFSLFNDKALPFPPSYNTGAGGPVNAATGQPIQSFQQWQQQNPGGMSINATPAQPAAAPPTSNLDPRIPNFDMSSVAPNLFPNDPTRQANYAYELGLGGRPSMPGQGAAATPQAAAAPQASGPPNNWGAALNALANPGNPVTQGANVPMVSGYQPAGGVNQAFLNRAGQGQGMNQNFLSALRAIQGR